MLHWNCGDKVISQKEIKTCKLVQELGSREAVQHILINPYEKLEICIDGKKQALQLDKGPASVLLIWD